MNREDVLRMAREAELICEETAQTQWQEDYDLTLILERFAALVASAEREACVKAIEDQIGWDMDDPESTAIKAIRARSKE